MHEPSISEVAPIGKRMGIYDTLPAYESMALGAGDTTLMRMATAYADGNFHTRNIRAFIEADEDLAEQDFDDPPQTSVSEDGVRSSVRLCYALRLPRSFDAYMMRYPVFTVAHLASAMCEQPDVETTFGHISDMNYLQLLGVIMKLSPKRGESCITLNRRHAHTIQLSAGKPIMLFRVSRPRSESVPPPEAA